MENTFEMTILTQKKCIIHLFAQSPLNNSNFGCKSSMKPPPLKRSIQRRTIFFFSIQWNHQNGEFAPHCARSLHQNFYTSMRGISHHSHHMFMSRLTISHQRKLKEGTKRESGRHRITHHSHYMFMSHWAISHQR